MTINHYWLNQDKYKLQDAAYLVCGLEPQHYPADYGQSGAPIMVVRAYAQMQSYATNRSYLWEQYSLSRDELCYYAWEFGGADVVAALGLTQDTAIQQDHSAVFKQDGYILRNEFASQQLTYNPELAKIKPLVSLYKKLNNLAIAEKNNPVIKEGQFNPTWWRQQSVFSGRRIKKT